MLTTGFVYSQQQRRAAVRNRAVTLVEAFQSAPAAAIPFAFDGLRDVAPQALQHVDRLLQEIPERREGDQIPVRLEKAFA